MEHGDSTTDRTAHDLKNQLGIFLGLAELALMDCPVDDPRRDDLEEMQRAARTALELVTRLFPPEPHR